MDTWKNYWYSNFVSISRVRFNNKIYMLHMLFPFWWIVRLVLYSLKRNCDGLNENIVTSFQLSKRKLPKLNFTFWANVFCKLQIPELNLLKELNDTFDKHMIWLAKVTNHGFYALHPTASGFAVVNEKTVQQCSVIAIVPMRQITSECGAWNKFKISYQRWGLRALQSTTNINKGNWVLWRRLASNLNKF